MKVVLYNVNSLPLYLEAVTVLNKTPSQLIDYYYFVINESGFLMITTKGYVAVIFFSVLLVFKYSP